MEKTKWFNRCPKCREIFNNTNPFSSHTILGEVLAELMAEVEQENKEECVNGMSLTNSEGNQIKLDDLAYGYELRFKRVLGKYFA